MKVKNINGTEKHHCKCGSWLNHWKNFSRQPIPRYCPAHGCMETDLVGAHVQKDSILDKDWYIVPLCRKHNAKESELYISDGINLVSANKIKTCEA